MDCACGTGHLDLTDLSDQRSNLREFYFLPDPHCFILTHFPLSLAGDVTQHTSDVTSGGGMERSRSMVAKVGKSTSLHGRNNNNNGSEVGCIGC